MGSTPTLSATAHAPAGGRPSDVATDLGETSGQCSPCTGTTVTGGQLRGGCDVSHPRTDEYGDRLTMPALKVCTGPGRGHRCPTAELIPKGRSRCATCSGEADKARRPEGNPYNTAAHQAFRYHVLAADPICVVCKVKRSTVADHYPHSRKELVRLGLNPDDPKHGRGLCKSCHDSETAEHQPGGWNAH